MDVVEQLVIDDEDETWEAIICVVESISQYYQLFIHKEPCMDSFHTGLVWLLEIMRGNKKRCLNMFRMNKDTLISLSCDLEVNYGLQASKRMTILEKVAMFIYTLALGASNRQVQEQFQHSGETVSRNFHEVMKVMLRLSIDIIQPKDPFFQTIPTEILNDTRYMPHFKDCVGAIDGTHIPACVREEDQVRFIGRKGIPTQNIMAACSFDMQFTFVMAGWEGTAHDGRLFQYALHKKDVNFPKPPPGKYYLVDAGYSQIEGHSGGDNGLTQLHSKANYN